MNATTKTYLPNGSEVEMADYKEQIISEYKGNPFIEALPPIMTKLEAMDKLAVYPYYDEEERFLEPEYRFHLIQRVYNYFQPFTIHLELEAIFSRIIRQGYLNRNILHIDYASSFNKGYQLIIDGEIQLNNIIDNISTLTGFAIIGASGMGKTTAVNRILSNMPQVISHGEYKKRKINTLQVVYIKINCPFDGSIRAICIEFFNAVDKIIGTSYYVKYSKERISTNVMLPLISQIAQNINLGCLIVDEIQHLSSVKSGGAEKMLNFFVTLVNQIALPIILIGTPKSMEVLGKEFRQSRRMCGQGDIIFERMKKDSTWQLFIEGLFAYQWTKKITPLSKELSDELFEQSQGIADIAKKMYSMSQIKAISSGKEEITVELIRKVAKENFRIIKPAMEALKSGNIVKISKYEDIAPINIDEFVQKELSNINYNKELKELQQLHTKKSVINSDNVKEQAILKLLELGVEPNKAKWCIEQVIERIGVVSTTNEIVREAYKLTFENITVEAKKKKNMMKIYSNDENDLRFICLNAKKSNVTAHEALKEKGYIKDLNSDLL